MVSTNTRDTRMNREQAHFEQAHREQAVRFFHALSDQTRVEIIKQLQGGELCVCELMDTLDAAQSRLSFHLRVLKDAGLVMDRREGRWSYYELRRGAFKELAEVVRAMTPRARITSHSGDGCCG